MSQQPARVAVIVPAAGSGQRLGGGTPKALRLLDGSTLLDRSLAAMAAHPAVVEIVVALPASQVDAVAAALPDHGIPIRAVAGGSSRRASVAAALAATDAASDIVLVHDAARPLVPADMVARVIEAVAAGAPAVVPGLPVVDTIKRIDDRHIVLDTPPRDSLRAVQTPQGFRREVLLAAHAQSGAADDATDDAALAERCGYPVVVVAGDPAAMKITTPDDFARAEALLHGRSTAALPRVGIGVDVHRFGSGRTLMLAGLAWPGEPGLEGHSDADAACHAAADALFSAAGIGDLGSHFGTAEPRWAGAAGLVLLAEAAARVRAAGFDIGNVAVQVIGTRPRVGTRRGEAEQGMSRAVGAPVSLSATTTDGLGLTGRGEGIAAMATAVVIGRA